MMVRWPSVTFVPTRQDGPGMRGWFKIIMRQDEWREGGDDAKPPPWRDNAKSLSKF
ncbi:hypothetical protein BGZ63DRAFT_18374 [Mariannaea sp. PMI_226]|nr:hypothetical protein BGZ63DRAFT_18374 [Mariannaea sp. PMI_226]